MNRPYDPVATDSLVAHSAGDPHAAARLLPLVYDSLSRLAANYMRNERSDHSLEPAALVNEAFIRLIDLDRIDWKGKAHFFAMAARQMRRILVEHARKRDASKRGGGFRRVTLSDDLPAAGRRSVETLALHEALEKLARRSPRQAQTAELRYFGGLTVNETAHALGVSERTVRQDWRVAKAWLSRELSRGPRSADGPTAGRDPG